MTATGSPVWLQALSRPDAYPHPARHIQRLETHISWVILAGEHAYKIKKPVNLGFLDYSTLAKRHFYCQEELRLNRRLAAPLYLGLSSITGPSGQARVDGDGPPLEYAVHMRRFPQDEQFDRLLAAGHLEEHHLESLAEQLARFHREIATPAPPQSDFGTPEVVIRPMRENFTHLEGVDPRLSELRHWTERRYQSLRGQLESRRCEGHIRECHGDLHLANIVLWEGRPLPFDGIEFDPYLRWIDVQSELAFLTMDLEDRGRPDLAYLSLNTWLTHSGDHAGLRLLPFYQTYRAMVRAKVNHIRRHQAGLEADQIDALEAQFQSYLRLAHRYTRPRARVLILTCGVSGSGKSHLARRLAMALGAIHIRSDVERKRLHGLAPRDRPDEETKKTLYGPRATRATYQRLLELAETVLDAGFPVIVDATFLHPEQRLPFQALAQRLGLPYHIIHAHAPEVVLVSRVQRRAHHASDPSDADLAVLRRQLAKPLPWREEEHPHRISVPTHVPFPPLPISPPPIDPEQMGKLLYETLPRAE